MSPTIPPDREVGSRPGSPGGPVLEDRRDYPMTAIQGGSDLEDSSGPLFSIYCDAAMASDSAMVGRWQKHADGFAVFAGLFSAAVAALLAVTVQDLRPNSQDISAFYLGNIYQVLSDPNVTRTSVTFPVAKPPPFSPPRYAVWVNSLWFLSFVMSLSCALWIMSLQEWARVYLYRVQHARYSPERRARMRAFFAGGVDKMHIPWAVEGLPMLLHLSLFLFFGGLSIFLFNVNREVFGCVIWPIVLFSIMYVLVTLLPLIRHDSPYHTPLSKTAWFLYASIHHIPFKILAFITLRGFWSYRTWRRCEDLRDHYQGWILGGVEKAAEETALERPSDIDVQILDWTISALGDDESLKSFFEAIPRSFNSKMLGHLKSDIPWTLRRKIVWAMYGFCDRTLSSSSISDSEKVRRLDISYNATNQIGETHDWLILFLFNRLDVPQTVEMGHTLARWFTDNGQDIGAAAQCIFARILVNVRERNDSWVMLATQVFGLSERNLRDNIALGDESVLLAILIQVTLQSLRSSYPIRIVLDALSKFDIRNTHPKLQHDFCTLWNEIVQEARKQGPYSALVDMLRGICHPYITLHQGTDAAPTAFSASTDHFDHFLYEPSSYPFCNLASHRPHSLPHVSVALPTQPNNSDASSPGQVNNIIELPSSSYTKAISKIRTTTHNPDMTPPANPVYSSSRPTGALRTAVVIAAPPDITSTATLSHPLEGIEQKDSDIVASSAEPGTSQLLSIASMHAPTPTTPTPTLVLNPISSPNTPSESYNAGVRITSNSSHIVPPFIGFSVPASLPTRSATHPRLRIRGLVNAGNTCFANAVLQLLVNSPPLWNLFKELGDLKGQREAGVPETGGGATPLVEATVRFFREFEVEEELSSVQQQSLPATGGTSRADEENKCDNVVIDSFEPTYLYDAMKEKNQLKPLLDGQQQDAGEFLCQYLVALDEELAVLLSSISVRQSASAALKVEEHDVSQPGQTEVGYQSIVANLVGSPITRIFGGKFRSPVRALNQPDLVPADDWRSLDLDIQPDSVLTVEDALIGVSQSQSIQGGPGLSDASQQMLIEMLPPVLVLRLKRFRCDVDAGGVIKIGKPVQFSSELEIPSDILVPNAQQTSESPRYKLYGALYHHGKSAGSGHYTVDVLHRNGEGDTGEVWLHIDNEVVTPMRNEDVFGEHGTELATDGRCAYLLFYCRNSPTDTS